ncbi:MAG TPA: D-2-hydroxyacid dehydrogenase [Gemmatimonadaceae bacterium]
MSALDPRRVVIGAPAHATFAAALRAARPELEIRHATVAEITSDDLAWGDAYLGFKRPPLPTMGNIRWVHCSGAGVDAWLYPVELPKEILLTKTSESFGPMIAEWALARALAFCQDIIALASEQRQKEWRARDPRLIRGTTAVVVGTGDVGSHVARAFAAMGCRIVGVSRTGRGDPSVFSKVARVDALRETVAEADWLVLMLPLTASTDGLVTREILSACRGATLINAGRGAVVDEAAIPEALDTGWLHGAALDVFRVEPLPQSSPLWNDPRVMISPHNSGPTTVSATITGFVQTLDEILRSETPTWAVDRGRQY